MDIVTNKVGITELVQGSLALPLAKSLHST